MSLADLKEWATVASLASPVLMIVAVALMSRYFPTRKEAEQALATINQAIAASNSRINAVELRQQSQSERMNKGDVRFATLDLRIEALPTSTQIADLRVALERCMGEIKTLGEQSGGLEELLRATRTHLSVLDEHIRGLGR